jgi:beta-lactamase class A
VSSPLEEGLQAIAARLPGTLGVAIHYLPGGPTAAYHADDQFPTASVIKVPVMVEAFAQAADGALRLDRRVPFQDSAIVEGSGILRYLQPGLQPTVRDLIELMIIVSDNTATNLVIDLVGIDAVNARMRSLGLRQTRLGGRLAQGLPAQEGHGATVGRSVTTPHEMCRLFELLWRGVVVSADASREMLEVLGHQQFTDLARYLPVDDLTEDAGRRASPVLIAAKSGQINGVRNDVGLITARTAQGEQPYIVSVFTRDVADESLWTVENVAVRAIGEVSRLAYAHLLAVPPA